MGLEPLWKSLINSLSIILLTLAFTITYPLTETQSDSFTNLILFIKIYLSTHTIYQHLFVYNYSYHPWMVSSVIASCTFICEHTSTNTNLHDICFRFNLWCDLINRPDLKNDRALSRCTSLRICSRHFGNHMYFNRSNSANLIRGAVPMPVVVEGGVSSAFAVG